MYEKLCAIGHILLGSGSDSCRINLNSNDARLLGIDNSKEQVEEIYNDLEIKDGKAVSVEQIRKSPAVIPVKVGENVRAYDVNVGFARKVLSKKLDGRGIDGQRQPDEPMAETPVDELASA